MFERQPVRVSSADAGDDAGYTAGHPFDSGSDRREIGVAYSYTVVTHDSEDDEVFYYVDWGDATNSSWVGPYPSDENVTIGHTFRKKRNLYHQGKSHGCAPCGKCLGDS